MSLMFFFNFAPFLFRTKVIINLVINFSFCFKNTLISAIQCKTKTTNQETAREWYGTSKNCCRHKRPEECTRRSTSPRLHTWRTQATEAANKTTTQANQNRNRRYKSTTTSKSPNTINKSTHTKRSIFRISTPNSRNNSPPSETSSLFKTKSKNKRQENAKNSIRRGPVTIMSSKWSSRWKITDGRMKRMRWGDFSCTVFILFTNRYKLQYA